VWLGRAARRSHLWVRLAVGLHCLWWSALGVVAAGVGVGRVAQIQPLIGAVLQGAAAFGLLLLIAAYAWLGQPAAWWAPRLDALLGPAFAAQGLDTAQYFPALARWMTAMSVAALMFGALMSLLLAACLASGFVQPGWIWDGVPFAATGQRLRCRELCYSHDRYVTSGSVAELSRMLWWFCWCVSAAGIGAGACSRTQPTRPPRLVNWFVCSVAYGCAAGDAAAGIIGWMTPGSISARALAECLNLGDCVDLRVSMMR